MRLVVTMVGVEKVSYLSDLVLEMDRIYLCIMKFGIWPPSAVVKDDFFEGLTAQLVF